MCDLARLTRAVLTLVFNEQVYSYMDSGESVMPGPLAVARKSDPTLCRACAGDLDRGHVRINGRAVCVSCHRKMRGSPLLAVAAGLGAAILAVALYYAVLAAFSVRFLPVAVLAGVMVGAAVRRGRGYHVSMPYRLYAIGLTYLAVVSTYTHAVLELPTATSSWQAWLDTWTLPVRMAAEGKSLVTLVLLSLGMFEAFRFSAPPLAKVEGPFDVDGSPLTDVRETADTD